MNAQAVSVDKVTTAVSKPRLLYIDNLRILLGVLVIVFHLAITYGASGDWGYVEQGPLSMISAILLTLFVGVCQAFFMGLFFMLSSYFSPGSYDRKGAGAYIADRLKRLGIPLLLFFAVILPATVYARALLDGYRGSLGAFLGSYIAKLDSFGDGPLWFVEALLIFSILYALWRKLFSPAPVTARESQAPSNGAIALFALALGALTFIVRLVAPVGWNWEPLHWQLGHFSQYAAMFILGIVAYQHGWFTALTDAQGKLWRWVAIGLTPLLLVLSVAGGALDDGFGRFVGGLYWQSLAYALWEQFICMAMVVTLLVWFRNRFNQQGKLAKAMAADVYATYVFFMPVIVLLAVALRGIKLEMGIKFLLVSPLAVALCFLVGHYVRKLPGARDIL